MTIVEIDDLLNSVEWKMVDGADARAIGSFLEKFPLDETASRGRLWDALTKSQSELAKLRSTMELRESSLSQLKADVGLREWEIWQLKTENSQLRTEAMRVKAENMLLKGHVDARDAERAQLGSQCDLPNSQTCG
jgi:SMC interacting uncharacterized protein involved in chromosome segregation